MIEFIYWVTIGSLLMQIIYWLFLTHYLTKSKRNSDDDIAVSGPVSIIICARNEAANLKKHLPAFLDQKNVVFELIVVNDHSEDETLSILKEFCAKHPALVILDMSGDKIPGKKSALKAGIQHARYENILLSDADCSPMSPFWSAKMVSNLDETHQLVAGYSPFKSQKSWVGRFSTFENIITALQYIGFGKAGMPYMAVGRNMAYKAKLIKKVNYFEAHEDLRAGDDDLTVQSVSAITKINYVLDEDTFVLSESADTWKKYFKQKARHYSVSSRYSFRFIIILGLFVLTWALYYAGVALLLCFAYIWMSIILLLIRYFLILCCFNYIQKTLHQKLPLSQVLLFDAAFPFFMGILSTFGFLKKDQDWK